MMKECVSGLEVCERRVERVSWKSVRGVEREGYGE